ncbi:hypothetical protein FPZ12_000505 [Amycolatopsis acidicola]|uniref:ABC transporter n=1 Tax=Amycolatopsis acidicola TaxID=2596893 RepID=A0A5N0VQ41_9PSEU|nr:hypothetical protein [Amycolatopsis acidicola]KAA9166731.1 hypothetical protein FPZ12_000505 [Amycolatopsis acidicola]
MIRYQLALLLHTQRYVPPLLAYLLLLGILYTDVGAVPVPELAVSAGALSVVACWLTIALVDAEDPVQRLITLVHARRVSQLLLGIASTALALSAVATVVSLAWSSLEHHGLSAGDLGLGLLAHLTCACTGIAIGLPCSRLLVPRIGYTVMAALAGLVAVLLIRWLPLINPMLRAMTSGSSVTGAILWCLVVSAAVLALSATVTGFVHQRRN